MFTEYIGRHSMLQCLWNWYDGIHIRS